jgi:hypothetical protein
VKEAFRGSIVLAVLGGCAAFAVAMVQPGETTRAIDAYLLYLGALAVLALTRSTRELAAGGSQFEAALRSRPRPRGDMPLAQVPELARTERELALASATWFDLHVRLRPRLRDVAADRLLRRHGVGLDSEPERARALLGETAWDILRPDRQPPLDRLMRGPELATIAEVVDSVERL